MQARDGFSAFQRPLAILLVVLLACAALGAVPAAARPSGALTFTDLTPPPDSVVPAGPRTVAANVGSTGNVGRIALVLNSQPLSFATGGPSASQVGIFTERILAPGDYTVQLVAEDSTGDRREVSRRFQVQQSDRVPDDFSQADAKIQIVYPHDGAPVSEATLANIGVYLFLPGSNYARALRLQSRSAALASGEQRAGPPGSGGHQGDARSRRRDLSRLGVQRRGRLARARPQQQGILLRRRRGRALRHQQQRLGTRRRLAHHLPAAGRADGSRGLAGGALAARRAARDRLPARQLAGQSSRLWPTWAPTCSGSIPCCRSTLLVLRTCTCSSR